MLRNAGVNVTEHKIRQDVQKAYEYDYFHEGSRYGRRRDQEVRYMGYKTHMRRQPRYYYSTKPRHLPNYYQSARSSILSYTSHPELDRVHGVKMIYLPERDSGESSYFIRKPSYREKYYSNQKPYHMAEVERPLRRDFRFNPESPRRTSSMYLDENRIETLIDATRCIIDNYCPKRNSSKYRKPVGKITEKLSPILTCDCTTPLSVRPSKRTYTTKLDSPIRTHQKAKSNNLSKEAKMLSQDIFDILTLLQKAEAEEEERYSSDSVLQHVHSFDCSGTNNITRRKTDLITERVQIYPKMDKKRQEPLAKLKNITGVRSKLEALVNILKQYEHNSGSKADILPKNENPPSPGDIKSCNDETKECQGRKDILLQTEEPKTSDKSICGRTMKNNSIEVMKSLKARFSSKVKEKKNTKKRKESGKQKMVKQDEGKSMFNYKETSKDKTLPDNEASKQNLADNCHEIKTGLMITIGGKVLRKKPAAPEKRLDRMSKTWLKKYLDTKKDTKDNNIHQRWNNRAFYNHSSTTVVEVINNVYKQMGINLKSKYYDVLRKSHTPVKSPKKTRNRQTVQAYMMPQTVMHEHVYMSEDILIAKRQVTKNKQKFILNTKLPFEQNINMQNKYSTYSNILNLSNDPSSIFFRIYLPKDYFDTVSTSNQTLKTSTSDERVYKITEYEDTKSDGLNFFFTVSGSLKGDKPAIVHNKEKNDVQVNHGACNSCFLPKCEVKKKIVSQQVIKNNTDKLEPNQMQEPVGDEANLYTPETSNVRGREKPTHNQNAKIQYLIALSNIPSTYNKKSEDTELQFTVVDKSTKTENINTTVTEDFTEADHTEQFYYSRRENSMSNDQVLLKIQSTTYLFQLQNPLVHQMSFRSLQHLGRPEYLPHPSHSYPLATWPQRPKPQYPPNSQLVCLSKYSLKPQFIPSVAHDAAETQYLAKFQTKLELQHAYQTQYTPEAEPSFKPKYAYLDTKIYYLTQMSKFGNITFSSNKMYICAENGTEEVQLKLTTIGGKIANIYISNDGHSARLNNFKLTYRRKSQENVANNNAVKQIVKPTVQILKSSVKIHFSVENIKARDFKISGNQIYHVLSKKQSENVCDTYHITARSHSDSAVYKSKLTNQNCPSLFHHISRHLHSKGTDPLNVETRDNSVRPSYISESTIRRINSTNKTADPKVTNSSLENYNVIEEYVKKLLNETIKMNNNNLKRVAETKRMLTAIMMMNASGCANITSANEELINDLKTSVKIHLSMYKEIVKMFKKLRENNKKVNLLEQQIDANNDESDVVKSKTNTSSNKYNILARTLTICQKVDTKSNNYIRTKRDRTASCCLLNSGYHAKHQHFPVTKKAPSTFSFSSMISSLKRNAVVSTGTVFGNRKYSRNGTSTSCREPKSKVQSLSKDKLYPNVKRTFSEWTKYVKRSNIKTNEKIEMQMKTEVRDATSSAYLLVEPYRSQEKLYIVVDNDTFQNKNPVKIDDESEILNHNPVNDILYNVTNTTAYILQSDTVKKAKILNNVTNPADILQSDKVKKAVLQIYIEDSKTHKDYMVAKLPKFLSL